MENEFCLICEDTCIDSKKHRLQKLIWTSVSMTVFFGIAILVESVPSLKAFTETYVFNSQTILSWVLVVVGTIGYLVREYLSSAFYGLLEIIFALVCGLIAIGKVSEIGFVEILGFMALIFIVVRGVDNIGKSLSKSIEQETKRRADLQALEDEKLLFEVMPYYR